MTNENPTSVNLTTEDVQQLDALAQRWKLSRSAVVRRLLKASKRDSAMAAIEEASWPAELPHAMRYRVAVKDVTVPIKMGPGLPSVPHTFHVGRIIDRGGYLLGYVEHLHRHGVLLEPVAD